MRRAPIVVAVLALALGLLVFLGLAVARRVLEQEVEHFGRTEPATAHGSAPPTSAPSSQARQGFLYGRVLTTDGTAYQGRLRFGGGEEAFWGDHFNGFKAENPWAALTPPERLKESHPLEVFGVEIVQREREIDLRRPFMARFGDIARIEAAGRDLRVTLKSGTVFELDRYSADDFADGVRVWDAERGVVDLVERRMRRVELLSTAQLDAVPDRLHGTVRTRGGEFTGFVQWNRRECVGSDELGGRTDEGEARLRFDTLRSIARTASRGVLVTLRDGRELGLSGTRATGDGNLGVSVEDPRFGRVLVSWEAFERVDFSPGGSGPAYDDFPPGRPLAGTVTTRAGDRLAGRLVYDLDESETTETLDAPAEGVDYTIPFGLVASIALPEPEGPAAVALHGGEEIRLDRRGDLGEENAGLLVFVDGRERPTHVRWIDVQRVDLDRPPTMYPPLDRPGTR